MKLKIPDYYDSVKSVYEEIENLFKEKIVLSKIE